MIASSGDLPKERPLLPVNLGGKPYVLFRDNEGELGLIGRHCPHRGADLCFGRLEDNGLRCPFHGWHFDRAGQCLEQPAEPDLKPDEPVPLNIRSGYAGLIDHMSLYVRETLLTLGCGDVQDVKCLL